MKKIIVLVNFCFAINIVHSDAQTSSSGTDAAQIISGTYKGVVKINKYGKEEIINQNASISVQKTGEGKVRVSSSGGKSFELQVKIEGSYNISSFYTDEKEATTNAYISLDISGKPVKLNARSGNTIYKEGDEYWICDEATTSEVKPESLPVEGTTQVSESRDSVISKYKDQYGRNWNGPFPFNSSSILTNAPKDIGVYQILKKSSNDYEVMYIGIATAIATGSTIYKRLTRHFSGIGNKNIASIGDPSNFWFVYWLCDPKSAKQIESNVITNNKPPFNVKPEYKNYIENIYVH